ncbi:MAG TPA: hypothetical protein VNQ90_02815 [Chthoniobacteraceae bacterium]|nr:hypothetical protein [Chthoniobacteraceae bacterium]
MDFDQKIEVTGPELAAVIALTPTRVQQLSREGIIRKASRGKYLLWPSISNYVAYLQERAQGKRGNDGEPVDAGSYEAHRARLYKERADREEMENAVRRGELHAAEAVVAHIGPMLAAFKAKVLSIPNATAAIVADLDTPDACQAALEEHCREACEELSEYDPQAIAGQGAEVPTDDEEEEVDD